MGIDVYLNWEGKTEEDERKQLTGFSVVSGDVGYLREAYHGGPYATKVLMPEGWTNANYEHDNGVEIPASTLKERLPRTVLTALYRDMVVYGGNRDVGNIDLGNGQDLKDVIAPVINEASARIDRDRAVTDGFDGAQCEAAQKLIDERKLPGFALAFVDFVRLAEIKEQETGKPCRVYVRF